MHLEVGVVLEAQEQREQQVHRLNQRAVAVHWHIQQGAYDLGIGCQVHVLQHTKQRSTNGPWS